MGLKQVKLSLYEQDIIQFRVIKTQLAAKTDIDTLRKLMNYFLMSRWIEKLFEQFEQNLITTLHQSLFFQTQYTHR